MLSPEELKESPLFQNISYESYLAMYDCFQAVNRTFRPYEVMYDYTSGSVSADSDSVGVIERGTASLIRIDENGVATVLEELGPGGVFGKALAFAGSSQDVLEVVCRTACEVVYIRYSQILKRCENACLHHSLLVQNMLRLISEKAQALSQRVDVLSRRSIRPNTHTVCSSRQRRTSGATSSLVSATGWRSFRAVWWIRSRATMM